MIATLDKKPLLKHQEEAISRLFNQEVSNNVLIGDAPRVGKTFEAIGLEQRWRNRAGQSGIIPGGGKTLVVCLSSFALKPFELLKDEC